MAKENRGEIKHTSSFVWLAWELQAELGELAGEVLTTADTAPDNKHSWLLSESESQTETYRVWYLSVWLDAIADPRWLWQSWLARQDIENGG